MSKERLYKCVCNSRLNSFESLVLQIVAGNAFHATGPQTQNARCPSLVQFTIQYTATLLYSQVRPVDENKCRTLCCSSCVALSALTLHRYWLVSRATVTNNARKLCRSALHDFGTLFSVLIKADGQCFCYATK